MWLFAQEPEDIEPLSALAPTAEHSKAEFLDAKSRGEIEVNSSSFKEPSETPTQVLPPTGPDVFLLPDKTGKLRMVLGFPYEEFPSSFGRKKNKNTNSNLPVSSLATS